MTKETKDEKTKRIAASVAKRAAAAKVKLDKKNALEKKRELAKDKKIALEKKRELAKDKKKALIEKRKLAEDKKAAKILLSLAGPAKKATIAKKATAGTAVVKSQIRNNDIIQIRMEEAQTLRKLISQNTGKTAECVKRGADLLQKLDFVEKRLAILHPTIKIPRKNTVSPPTVEKTPRKKRVVLTQAQKTANKKTRELKKILGLGKKAPAKKRVNLTQAQKNANKKTRQLKKILGLGKKA